MSNLTIEQFDEAMAVFTEDILSLGCWGCREPGQPLFMCPYLTMVQRTFTSVIMRKTTRSSPSGTWKRKLILQTLAPVLVASPVRSFRYAPKAPLPTNPTTVWYTT